VSADPPDDVHPLDEEQRAWLRRNLDAASAALVQSGIEPAGTVTRAALLALWDRLRADPSQDPYSLIDLFAAAGGQLLTEQLDVDWVAIGDEGDTTVALYGPNASIFPLELVTSDLERDDPSFLRGDTFAEFTQLLESMEAGSPPIHAVFGAQVATSTATVEESASEQQVEPPSDGDWAWIRKHLDAARSALADLGYPEGQITADGLDRLWSFFLLEGDEPDDPNPVINLVGVGFGQLLVDELGLSWVVITDEYGTDVAVRGNSADGNVTVFPTNFIAKRWPDRTTGFIAPAYAEMSRNIASIRAGNRPEIEP
jgi:hypothetical protein